MTKTLSFLLLPLIICAILLSLFPHVNQLIFIAINQALPSKALWVTITNMGDATFLACVIFIVLHKNNRLLINALICAVLIHYCIKFTKMFFAVPRPEHTPDILHIITLGPALNLDNYAMPSGHTASVFMAVIFIARAYKFHTWTLWILFSYATLIGISRIAVGAHWPADILAGAALGIIFGLICTHEKLQLKHASLKYINLACYVPFIYFAIQHVRYIYDLTTLLNEGFFVMAGVIAFIVWASQIKSLLTNNFLRPSLR